MHFDIPTPSGLYIARSKSQRGKVKAGKADLPADRVHELALADPDLTVLGYGFFLDGLTAEAELHSRLAKAGKRYDRETFVVGPKKALAVLQQMVEEHVPVLQRFASAARFLVDVDAINLGLPEALDTRTGSALDVLLNHVPSARDGRTVRTLVSTALTAPVAAGDAIKLLAKRGLLTYAVDGVVLFDRTKTTGLEQVFAKHPCRETWRKQFAKMAGLRRDGSSYGLTDWLDHTEATQELVECVNPL